MNNELHFGNDQAQPDDAFLREVAAIQEGIDATERGDVRPFDEFDREFRLKHNIPLDW